MLFRYVLLFFLNTCVITTQAYDREFQEDLDNMFHSWPSIHVADIRLKKRQAEIASSKAGQSDITPLHVVNQTEHKSSEVPKKLAVEQISEGNVEIQSVPSLSSKPTKKTEDVPNNLNTTLKSVSTASTVSDPVSQNDNVKVTTSKIPTPVNTTKVSNSSIPKAPSNQLDLSSPGVMKRGVIVFGAFALMAVAYFVFYRRKSKNNDSNNTHGSSDTNQFRYGVLQSDDRRDNLELSRIPLTMESDEDEDEDLEIFDLEQKKKSLSYVNLQTSDDFVVHESRENERDRENLLLDIEDANSDTLINWSSNGNKSIL